MVITELKSSSQLLLTEDILWSTVGKKTIKMGIYVTKGRFSINCCHKFTLVSRFGATRTCQLFLVQMKNATTVFIAGMEHAFPCWNVPQWFIQGKRHLKKYFKKLLSLIISVFWLDQQHLFNNILNVIKRKIIHIKRIPFFRGVSRTQLNIYHGVFFRK